MTREDYIDRRSDAEARLLGLLKQADLRVKQAYLAGDAEGERAARELFERLESAARLFEREGQSWSRPSSCDGCGRRFGERLPRLRYR